MSSVCSDTEAFQRGYSVTQPAAQVAAYLIRQPGFVREYLTNTLLNRKQIVSFASSVKLWPKTKGKNTIDLLKCHKNAPWLTAKQKL